MKTGAELITEERQRQIEKEGWTEDHDTQHSNGELALAACCYASPVLLYQKNESYYNIQFSDPWPDWWDYQWNKRQTNKNGYIIPNEELPNEQRIRNLVKAGALIAAEIDRLQRL
jgi:hypothetical protein